MIAGKNVVVQQVLIVKNPMVTVVSEGQAATLERVKVVHRCLATVDNCENCGDYWPCDAYRVADMIIEGRARL